MYVRVALIFPALKLSPQLRLSLIDGDYEIRLSATYLSAQAQICGCAGYVHIVVEDDPAVAGSSS